MRSIYDKIHDLKISISAFKESAQIFINEKCFDESGLNIYNSLVKNKKEQIENLEKEWNFLKENQFKIYEEIEKFLPCPF